ncbi:MAG: LPS export ABC transporter periplasmic protein LptC [Gammaproteobacteria bacterium]|nr:MAG: LPS export ABC transporter periplasmic protein LptC [Gammaproteobacteria bacterium]
MRNILLMVMLLGSTGIFLLFWLSPPEVFLEQPTSDGEELPKADSYMLNISMLTYNKNGDKANSMLATEARHFKRANRLEAENPDMMSFGKNPDDQPWHMTADKGTVLKGGEKAVFNGSVYAWQETGKGAKKELRTDKLILYPDTHVAETDRPVTIITEQGKTTGVGMWADLDAEIFRLLSKVKGVHRAL